jgi:hypothetical protein
MPQQNLMPSQLPMQHRQREIVPEEIVIMATVVSMVKGHR